MINPDHMKEFVRYNISPTVPAIDGKKGCAALYAQIWISERLRMKSRCHSAQGHIGAGSSLHVDVPQHQERRGVETWHGGSRICPVKVQPFRGNVEKTCQGRRQRCSTPKSVRKIKQFVPRTA
jgi:hypothetical protein